MTSGMDEVERVAELVKRLREDAAHGQEHPRDLLLEAADRLEALSAPPSEWLPIETAPKGEVLLYFPKVITGAHRQSTLPPMYRIGRVSDTPNRKPTRWRPLPAPPATAKDAQT